MKKFFALGLAVILTAIAVPTPAANAQGAGLVSSIFNKMERNRRDLRTLRAGISMDKWNDQIKSSDKRSGTMIYMPGTGRNSSVRVDWRSPVQEILSVADGQYTLFSPRRKTAWVGDANSKNGKVSGVLGFGLNATSAQLKSAYDVQDVYNETLWGGVAATHMKLIPKGGQPTTRNVGGLLLDARADEGWSRIRRSDVRRLTCSATSSRRTVSSQPLLDVKKSLLSFSRSFVNAMVPARGYGPPRR